MSSVSALAVPNATSSSLTLTWRRPAASGVTGYAVRREAGADAPTSTTDGSDVANVPSGSTTAVDTNLAPDTRYSYAVFAQYGSDYAPPTSTSAVTATTATVSGTVTDTSGAPVPGVRVDVFAIGVTPYDFLQAGHSFTGADGTYTVSAIDPSLNYTVCFDATQVTQGSTGLQSQCRGGLAWDGTDPPTNVDTFPLGRTEQRTDEDAVLSVGGAVAGVLTSSDGTALAGLPVEIYVQHYRTGDPPVITTSTDGSGHWRAIGLTPGSERYYPCYLGSVQGVVDQCWDGAAWTGDDTSGVSGTTVTIQQGETTDLGTTSLARGATVTGQVLESGTGAPLAGATVRAATANDESGGSAVTDSLGDYTIRGLRPGSYQQCATGAAATGGSSPAGYDMVCTDPVDVTGTATTTTSAIQLEPAGEVTGRVTSSIDGKPIADVQVEVLRSYNGFVPDGLVADTDASGFFDVRGVPSDTVVVGYGTRVPVGGSAGTGFPNEDRSNVSVVAGETTEADEAITPAGGLSGTVTSAATGQPLAHAFVDLLEPQPDGSVAYLPQDTSTDSAGYWAMGLLDPTQSGVYVCVSADNYDLTGNDAGYVGTCYGSNGTFAGQGAPQGSRTVSITADHMNAGIDVPLATAAGASGTVASDGQPLSSEPVEFYTNGQLSGNAETNSSGDYVIRGLDPSASVVICAGSGQDTGDSQPKCWRDQPWSVGSSLPPDGASSVPLTAGQITDNVDLDLAKDR